MGKLKKGDQQLHKMDKLINEKTSPFDKEKY